MKLKFTPANSLQFVKFSQFLSLQKILTDPNIISTRGYSKATWNRFRFLWQPSSTFKDQITQSNEAYQSNIDIFLIPLWVPQFLNTPEMALKCCHGQIFINTWGGQLSVIASLISTFYTIDLSSSLRCDSMLLHRMMLHSYLSLSVLPILNKNCCKY